MATLEELLGLEDASSDVRRAQLLADNDRDLLRGLVAIRESRGLSQAEVGRRMGISQPSVAALERYDANPTQATLRRYANAVRALVRHEVVPDEGQLAGGDVAEWRTVYSTTAHVHGSDRSGKSRPRVQAPASAAEGGRPSGGGDDRAIPVAS